MFTPEQVEDVMVAIQAAESMTEAFCCDHAIMPDLRVIPMSDVETPYLEAVRWWPKRG